MEEAQELDAQIWMPVEAWEHRSYLSAHFLSQLQQLWSMTTFQQRMDFILHACPAETRGLWLKGGF